MACRGGRAQPVIFWVVLITLCAAFLFSVVTLMQKQCISHCSHCVKAYILCGVITCLSHVCLGKLGITFFFQGIVSKLVFHVDGWFIPLAITLIISFFLKFSLIIKFHDKILQQKRKTCLETLSYN